MSEQPEALWLARALIMRHGVESFEGNAAAELRRLHADNKRLYAQHASVVSDYEKAVVGLNAQRDALLWALKAFANEIVPNNPNDSLWVNARAAIFKATREQP